MITPEEAWCAILESTSPLQDILVSLQDSISYVLAQPVTADNDIPAVDRSAMDGFAVQSSDLQTLPAELSICGEVPAGSNKKPNINRGECVRIYTGANMPQDADTVVRAEDTECLSETRVRFIKPVTKGQDIFKQGENARKDDLILKEGTCLTPSDIGVCATVGCTELRVFSKPTVSILVTGEELMSASDKIETHQIRDSNGPMLAALVARHHFTISEQMKVPDNPGSTLAKIKKCVSSAHVTIVTGGVSVGDYDFVPKAILEAGGNIIFHGVDMKPGKPQLFAAFPGNRFAFGLPGNPLSVMTGFYEFVLPTLKRLSGLDQNLCRPKYFLPITTSVKSKGSRCVYHLGKLITTPAGIAIEPIIRAGSADVVAGSHADGVFAITPGTSMLEAGSIVKFTSWGKEL